MAAYCVFRREKKVCLCFEGGGFNNFVLFISFFLKLCSSFSFFWLDSFWPLLNRRGRQILRRFTSCVCVLRVRGTLKSLKKFFRVCLFLFSFVFGLIGFGHYYIGTVAAFCFICRVKKVCACVFIGFSFGGLDNFLFEFFRSKGFLLRFLRLCYSVNTFVLMLVSFALS